MKRTQKEEKRNTKAQVKAIWNRPGEATRGLHVAHIRAQTTKRDATQEREAGPTKTTCGATRGAPNPGSLVLFKDSATITPYAMVIL
jgi:hypothetical protein